ncbi:MAG: right-handed parallel beta-helix repeat-containing protein, partial [Ferruginibacter sp.]
MKKLLFLSLIVFANTVQAKNYYISATGNNSNNGLTPGTAWQTIVKLNASSASIAAGDSILFERGDIFYGGIIVTKAGLNFGAYGIGAKPVISGLSTVAGWVNLGGNIWEAPVINVSNGVNLVMRNNVIQQVGRYPNANAANQGYLTYTAATGTSITGPALSTTSNWTGAEVAIKFVRWDIVHKKVTAHAGGVVSFASFGSTPRVGYGYFFQRDPRTLDKDGEWYHNFSTSKLRMYFSTNNPLPYNIQIATVENLIASDYGSLSITNLSFNGAGKKAIYTHGGTGIIIKNCDVTNSGGEAITASSSLNVTVDNCTTNNSLGSGIRVLNNSSGTVNLSVTNCNIDSTSLIAGMEISDGVNGGAGLLCKGGSNVNIQNNTITNSGYLGMEWQGNNVYVKYNFLSVFCVVRNDGAGIYTVEKGGSVLPVRTNRNIISNIVINGIGNNNGTPDIDEFDKHVNGLYFDLGTRTVTVDSNTVAFTFGAGHHGNNNASLTITNNLYFDNEYSFSIQRFDSANLVRNMIIKKNIFYPYKIHYRNLGLDYPTLNTKVNDIASFGTLDSNYYSTNPGVDTSLKAVTTYVNRSNYVETYHPFSYLTGTIGIEKHSVNVVNTGTLEYNASNTPKVVSFPGLSKKDVFGNVYNNSVTIPAWSSKVLIANGTGSSSNKSPVANAGSNLVVALPTNIASLTGSGTDTDGTISSYAWSKISGPSSGTIASANIATTALNNLVQGGYQFQLIVTDNNGATGKDTMQVTVNAVVNQSPVANAGINTTITLPINTTTLTGSGTDANGTISSFAWLKISGPSYGTIASAGIATTALNNLVQGGYQYQLTVTDNNGATGKDTVQVTVNAAVNQSPKANAGSDNS